MRRKRCKRKTNSDDIKNKRRRKSAVLLRRVLNSIDIVPTDRKRTENFYVLCPLLLESATFMVTNAYGEIFCFAKCEIMFCRTL